VIKKKNRTVSSSVELQTPTVGYLMGPKVLRSWGFFKFWVK